jgi:hypothetical protein
MGFGEYSSLSTDASTNTLSRSIHLLQKSKGHSGSDNGANPFCKLEIWPYKKNNKSNVFIHSCSSGIGVFSVISPIMDLQNPYNFLELSE